MGIFDFLGRRFAASTPHMVAGGEVADDAASVYFQAAAIDTAISYVATALVSSEIKTLERGQEVRGDLYHRLNVRPNPSQSAAQLIEKSIYKLMADGEALIAPVDGDLYVADTFALDRRELGDDVFRTIYVDEFEAAVELPASQVIYLTFGNSRTKTLVDGLFAAYRRMLSAAVTGFEQGVGGKWLLSLDTTPSGDASFAKSDAAERNDPRSALQTFMRNANAVYVQTRGQSLEHISASGCSASDVVAIRKDAFETIAAIFRIPASMLAGNMTNIDDVMGQFLTFTVDPIARQLSQELTGKLVPQREWDSGTRIAVDTSRIQHTDVFDIAPSISQLIGAGFSLDEVREYLGWPLINTPEAQEHLITKNYGPLEETLRQMAGGGE